MARRLLRESQGEVPVFEKQGSPVVSGAVRRPGKLAVHFLHGRDHESADRAGPRLSQGTGKEETVPGRQRLVFPRTADKVIKAYAAANGMDVLGEGYTPLGHTVEHAREQIAEAKPDAVFNTLNGDSNVAFFCTRAGC
jgi:hypothetical protein